MAMAKDPKDKGSSTDKPEHQSSPSETSKGGGATPTFGSKLGDDGTGTVLLSDDVAELAESPLPFGGATSRGADSTEPSASVPGAPWSSAKGPSVPKPRLDLGDTVDLDPDVEGLAVPEAPAAQQQSPVVPPNQPPSPAIKGSSWAPRPPDPLQRPMPPFTTELEPTTPTRPRAETEPTVSPDDEPVGAATAGQPPVPSVEPTAPVVAPPQDARTIARTLAALFLSEDEELKGFLKHRIGPNAKLELDDLHRLRDVLRALGHAIENADEQDRKRLFSAWDVLCSDPQHPAKPR